MASKQISALTELTSVDTANDKMVILDASAPTEAKYVTPDNLVPDATTTMKGKSELATTAEVDTGTDTGRVVTPSGYNGSFATTAAAKIHAATAKVTPANNDEFALIDSAASNVLKRLKWSDLLAALGSGLAISDVYPVGSIYTSVVSTNPNTLFGFGTWVAFATGRSLIGIDTGDTDFDTVEETFGSKTHTLTSGEMPSHTHTQNSHTHTIYGATFEEAGSGTSHRELTSSGFGSSNVDSSAATATNQNTGGGGAHNNVHPVVVVYMWKRTV